MNIKKLIEQATTIEEHGWGASYEHFDKEKFAELVAAHEREECIQNVLQQYEGFGKDHQGVEYVKQRIVDAIRERSKA